MIGVRLSAKKKTLQTKDNTGCSFASNHEGCELSGCSAVKGFIDCREVMFQPCLGQQAINASALPFLVSLR